MLEHLLYVIFGAISGFLGGVAGMVYLWKRVNDLSLRLEQHFQDPPEGFTEGDCEEHRKACRLVVDAESRTLMEILKGDGTMENPGLASYVRETRKDVKRIWQHLQNGGKDEK